MHSRANIDVFAPGGPPPVRSASELFGLSRNKDKQVAVGNDLLLAALRLLVSLFMSGGCAYLKHPCYLAWIAHNVN